MTTRKKKTTEAEVDAESLGRAAAWRILAAPLTTVPDAELLARYAGLAGLRGLKPEAGSGFDSDADANSGLAAGLSSGPGPGADIVGRLRALALAAERTGAAEAAEDYQDLFIGLGRGKVVPYGSWHMAGALMDRPLARLRGDLRALGFARRAGVKEPEDHAGALCETMAMLAADDSALSFGTQKKFHDAHVAPWLGGLFAEVTAEAATEFYRALGEFGKAFTALEARHFSMPF